MPGTVKSFIILFALLAVQASAYAESVKLRHVASLYGDERGGAISRPEGAGCSGQQLVVADTGNSRLLRFVYAQGLFKLEGQVRIPELANPGKVQVNSKGEIFVLDEKQMRIVKIGPDGAFAGFVQASGVPAPELWVPRSIAVDGQDNLYVLDIAADRVLVLEGTGTFLRQIRYPGEYGFFSDIAVNPGGTLYALDSVGSRVYSSAPDATVLSPLSDPLRDSVRFPTALAVDDGGFIFVTDRNGGYIAVLNPAGSLQGRNLGMGWKEGLLRYPSQTCLQQENLFVADRENNRVQVFTVVK